MCAALCAHNYRKRLWSDHRGYVTIENRDELTHKGRHRAARAAKNRQKRLRPFPLSHQFQTFVFHSFLFKLNFLHLCKRYFLLGRHIQQKNKLKTFEDALFESSKTSTCKTDFRGVFRTNIGFWTNGLLATRGGMLAGSLTHSLNLWKF